MLIISRLNRSTGKLIHELKAYLKIIREGLLLKDKIVILIYLLSAPLRIICKTLGREHSRLFVSAVTIKNHHGLYFCGRSFNSARIVSSYYEQKLEKYFTINEGVFIDVGSHIGKYTVRVATKLGNQGKVIAIEPEPDNFMLLKKNVELNKLKNVLLKNIACLDVDDKTPFYIDSKATTLHSIFKNEGINGRKVVVEALSLDTLISHLNIQRVDLIKIDVEGAELNVLMGAKNLLARYHPKLIFEAWNENYLTTIERFLKDYDYSVEKIYGANYLAF